MTKRYVDELIESLKNFVKNNPVKEDEHGVHVAVHGIQVDDLEKLLSEIASLRFEVEFYKTLSELEETRVELYRNHKEGL